MLFYRIDATLMNFKMSGDKNKADVVGEIQSNCNMFYHKCKHSFYFYVSSIQRKNHPLRVVFSLVLAVRTRTPQTVINQTLNPFASEFMYRFVHFYQSY